MRALRLAKGDAVERDAMKVENTRSVSSSTSARKAKGAQAGAFQPQASAPTPIAPANSTAPVHSVDAILALQGASDTFEKRARQAKRGHDALNALEEVAKALISGGNLRALKARLEALAANAERTDEAGLDAILLEIDTRLAVEIAKLEFRTA